MRQMEGAMTCGPGYIGDCSSRLHLDRVLRLAGFADVGAIAAVLTAARSDQAFIPPLHSPEDDHRFVTERFRDRHAVPTKRRGGAPVSRA